MSNIKINNKDIEEKVLRDLRENVLFNILKNKKTWDKNLEKRREIYINHKKIMKHDAERWPDAIESYKKYKCFNSINYEFKEDEGLIYYKVDENNKIKITADILTNVGAIEKMVFRVIGSLTFEDLTDEDYKILQAFYRVSYTIGNCCPVWKNPSNGIDKDIVWNKLSLSGLYDENEKIREKYNGIDERDFTNNLNERANKDFFIIFPKKDLKPISNIVTKLYFQDYFNYDWQLISPVRNIIFKKGEYLSYRKNVFDFIKITTVLIVQRSYRIITDYKGNILRKQDKEIMEDILNTIGLENTKCIYSKKKRI